MDRLKTLIFTVILIAAVFLIFMYPSYAKIGRTEKADAKDYAIYTDGFAATEGSSSTTASILPEIGRDCSNSHSHPDKYTDITETCPACGGSGVCQVCRGTGDAEAGECYPCHSTGVCYVCEGDGVIFD